MTEWASGYEIHSMVSGNSIAFSEVGQPETMHTLYWYRSKKRYVTLKRPLESILATLMITPRKRPSDVARCAPLPSPL